MSLISIATRAVFRQLLVGKTWADGRVFDQPLDPISEVLRSIDGQHRPCIAVYTQEAKGKPSGLETQGGAQDVVLICYAYFPPTAAKIDAETVEFAIDNVGSGLALNTMGRQIDAAMHFGDPTWVAIWRKFVTQVEEKIERFVLVETERSVKIPTLEIRYDLRCVADADFAKPLYGAWAMLDAALRADDTMADSTMLADHLKGLIESPANMQPYAVFQGNFGLSDAAHHAIGLAPLATDPESGDVPDLEDVDGPAEITITGPAGLP